MSLTDPYAASESQLWVNICPMFVEEGEIYSIHVGKPVKMRFFVLPIFDGVIMDGHPIF